MQSQYNNGIIISSGDEANYPGKVKGFFKGQTPTPASFIAKTRMNLQIIASMPIGRDLLTLIEKRSQGIGTGKNRNGSSKKVTISHGWGTLTKGNYNTDAGGHNKHDQFTTTRKVAGHSMVMAGKGTSVNVRYNPNQDYSKLLKLKTPGYIALAHELIHAYHFMSGNMASDMSPDAVFQFRCTIMEEALTVGAGTYANTRISENAIRREHGLPIREYYNYPGDCYVKGRPRAEAVG